MQRHSSRRKIYRIIDANINRAKEGLRVCEEIARFMLVSRTLTEEFKKIRHKIDGLTKKFPGFLPDFLEVRKSTEDVGKNIYVNELKRSNSCDIFFANIQRVKESIRVLEEFSKLTNKGLAVGFKNLRYCVYDIEKKAAKKIFALSDSR